MLRYKTNDTYFKHFYKGENIKMTMDLFGKQFHFKSVKKPNSLSDFWHSYVRITVDKIDEIQSVTYSNWLF